MKVTNASAKLSLMALALAACSYSHAAEPGWYMGGSVGQSRATIDEPRITTSLMGSGFAVSSFDKDERSAAGKIFAGYQLNPYFALEGGYFNLGKFGYTASTLPPGTASGDIRLHGLSLDLVGTIPVTEQFSVFGRAGVIRSEARDNFSSRGLVNRPAFSPRQRDNGYKFGVGAQYAFTERLSVRGEIERYRINDAIGNKGDVDMASVGLVYRFGEQGRRPAPRMEPMPVVAVAAPAPTPAPAPVARVAAPAPLMKVALSADSLFDFNKSTVKQSGQQALDKLATDLKGINYDVVKVTGHTDRIGSHAQNMKLSTRRADAVKSYLVGSAGIPASKVTAVGINGSQPVTKMGDCVGKKPTKKLIACLQPDRRVDVEVSGTR